MINYGIISIDAKRKNNIKSIQSLLPGLPLAVEGFDGRSQKDGDKFKELYPDFDVESYAVQPVFPVSPARREGEIGCWMSHYHMWNQIVNRNISSALILEDDAYLDRNIIEFIYANEFGQDFVMFGHWAELNYITQAGAQALIALAPQLYRHYPVDEAMMHCVRLTGMREHGWPIPRGGKLPITRQLNEVYDSGIGA